MTRTKITIENFVGLYAIVEWHLRQIAEWHLRHSVRLVHNGQKKHYQCVLKQAVFVK